MSPRQTRRRLERSRPTPQPACVPTRRDPRVARGRAAEEIACRLLASRGYRILARNVRLAGSEIDIIAKQDSSIVFVEVRSRSSRSRGGPLETIGWEKQRRIARAAAAYLARVGWTGPARFDVVGVDWVEGHALPTIVRNAFEARF